MKWSALSTTNPILYIGYPTLEAWAWVVHKDAPIYAMLLTEPGAHGQHGHRTESLLIVCAQPDDHKQVHYNRIMVGQLSFLGDQPFSSKHTWIMDQAEHAWGLVKDWLGEQAFKVLGQSHQN